MTMRTLYREKFITKPIKAEHGLPVTHKVDYVRYWKELPLEGKIFTSETKDRTFGRWFLVFISKERGVLNAYRDIIMLYYIYSMYILFHIKFCINYTCIIKIFFHFFTSRRNDQQIEKGAALCLWSAEADGEGRKLKLATRNLGQPLIFWTFALSQQAPDILKITEADMCKFIIVWICWIFYFLSKNWKMTKTGKLRPKIGRQKLKDALFLLTRFTKYNS